LDLWRAGKRTLGTKKKPLKSICDFKGFYLVAGAGNHQNLRIQKSRPVGAAELRELVSQFKMVAGAGNHLNLLFWAAA
jgi:hypothetical protein